MKAKDKAKELVDKYSKIYFLDSSIERSESLDLVIAQQCALICVEEIIKDRESTTPDIHNMFDNASMLDRWYAVKEEINKL